jgi:hypothetical protein
MARMIGKFQWHRGCPYECCKFTVNKDSVRRTEERAWRTEAETEMAHPFECCSSAATCNNCTPIDYSDYWHGFAEDLDAIDGVTTNLERLPFEP